MIEFTHKQGQYLAFIHLYTTLNGVPPAEADMQEYFQTTPPSVHQMILRLEEKGLISRIPNVARSIRVIIPPEQLPELGTAIARNANSSARTWSQESYTKAYRFAAQAHNGQLVPGTDLPYIMHISFVSMEVIACLERERNHDGDLAIQCALLHDVIEDAPITYQDVEREFGKRVAQGVLALTKNETIAKEHRMRDSLMRIKRQPDEVWIVKLADRICNLAPPPLYWDKVKIEWYRKEAIEILDALHEASEYLSKRLAMKIEEYKRYVYKRNTS
jgi:(p)ppGpp synthase/HD superfamily hydrolase